MEWVNFTHIVVNFGHDTEILRGSHSGGFG